MRKARLFLGAASQCGTGAVPKAAEDAARRLRTRDITLVVPCNRGISRITFCTSRQLLLSTMERHKLLEVTRMHTPFFQMLGTNLSFTNMLACQHEAEERVSTRFTTQEATLEVEALALGECRAYLSRSYNSELLSSGAAAFPLTVERVLYNQTNPFKSIVNADLCSLVRTKEGEQEGRGEMGTTATSPSDSQNGVIPDGLYIPGIDAALLQGYFNYNMTLHAYHFLRQSDGISSPVVWLHTGVHRPAFLSSGLLDPLDPSRLSDRGILAVNAAVENLKDATALGGTEGKEEKDQGAEERATAIKELRSALGNAVRTSFGVMVQPLGAGTALERTLWNLQQRLIKGVAALQVGQVEEEVAGYIHSPALKTLLHSDDFHDYACQNVLSILTGDIEKSFQVAQNARQCTQDPTLLAPTIETIRRELHLQDLNRTLDMQVEDTKRTAIDYFCRCSTASLLQALKSLPEKHFKEICGQPFRCSKCNMEYRLPLENQLENTKKAE